MAFEQARWQEESNNALTRKTKSLQRINNPFNSGRITSNVPVKTFSQSRTKGVKPIRDSLFEQRKRLRQCFKCGDKYMSGHRCNAKGLHMIEGIEEEENEGMMELEGTMQDGDKEINMINEFGLSLNSLADSGTYNTIRIKGDCQGRDHVILIDSGSMHSFIDESMIKKLNIVTGKTT